MAPLAREIPNIDSAIAEIARFSAELTLPRGTIHVISDIHGEDKKVIEKSGFKMLKSIATNHALRPAVSVEQTVSAPLTLRRTHWGSSLLAHQVIFVAARSNC